MHTNIPAAVAALDRGVPVTLDDGRSGFVLGRCFSCLAGGTPRLESYTVMLTGGRGRASVRPHRVRPNLGAAA